jgi:hypothetical protein
VVHIVLPIGRGCGQGVQEHGHSDHVMAGPGEGRARSPLVVDGGSDIPGLSSSVGEVNHYVMLCLKHGLDVV